MLPLFLQDLEAIWKKYDKKNKKYLSHKTALKFLKDFAEVYLPIRFPFFFPYRNHRPQAVNLIKIKLKL